MIPPSDQQQPQADAATRETIIGQLDDRFVQSVAALRGGGRFALDGRFDLFDALVVEELPTEFGGFGDPARIADLMIGLTGWGCVEVDPADAAAVTDKLFERAAPPF